jgi:MFS family permease
VRLPGASAFRSLRIYNYRLYASGSLVSNIGTWMQRLAQDWLVLTQLTNHSASAVGLVMALQLGPQLLLVPFTGHAADHMDQRKLIMLTQASMGLVALVQGLLILTGTVELWQVYVLAFIQGCASAFDAPVRLTFVSVLVGEEEIPNAIGLNATSFNAARLVGPAAAGWTISAMGTGWAFIFNAASFAAVLASLYFLRQSELHHAERAKRKKGSFVEGLRYAWGKPDLVAMLVILFLLGAFGMNFAIFNSTMAVRVFHTDANGFGLLSSLMAVGTMVGSLTAASRSKVGFGSVLFGAAVFGVGCTLSALAPGYWFYAATLMISGGAAMTVINVTSSLMQLSTDPVMRGRVMALRVAVALGSTPIGSPIVGWVADRFGPRWALGVAAISGFAAAAVATIYMIRKREAASAQREPAPSRQGS